MHIDSAFIAALVGGVTDLMVSGVAMIYFIGMWRPTLNERFRGYEKRVIQFSGILAAALLLRGTWRLANLLGLKL